MESLYKVGDTVKIKQLSAKSEFYRHGINDEMVDQSGKTFKIVSIEASAAPEGLLPDDGCKYKLEDSIWAWASSMFEESPVKKSSKTKKSKESKVKISFHKKKKLKFNFNL